MGSAAGISGAVLWLRAKTLTGADGAQQASWVDSSGDGRSVTASAFGTAATTNPTLAAAVTPNGGPAVKFGTVGSAGKNTHRAFALNNLGPLLGDNAEMWAYVKSPAPTGNTGSPTAWTFGTFGDNGYLPYNNGLVYEQWGLVNTRASFTPPTPVGTGFRLIRLRRTATSYRMWIDGVLGYDGGASTSAWRTTPVLGRGVAQGGTQTYDQQYGGHIAEVMVFNRALTDAEAATLTAHFQAEHVDESGATGALASTLPAVTGSLAGTWSGAVAGTCARSWSGADAAAWSHPGAEPRAGAGARLIPPPRPAPGPSPRSAPRVSGSAREQARLRAATPAPYTAT